MFITVSVVGLCAVVATAATTGVITGLYVRAKMVKALGKMRDAIAIREVSAPTMPRPRKPHVYKLQKRHEPSVRGVAS
jgi:hypothetical protein